MSLKQHTFKKIHLIHVIVTYCPNLLEVQGKISCDNGNINEVEDVLCLSSVEVLEDV